MCATRKRKRLCSGVHTLYVKTWQSHGDNAIAGTKYSILSVKGLRLVNMTFSFHCWLLWALEGVTAPFPLATNIDRTVLPHGKIPLLSASIETNPNTITCLTSFQARYGSTPPERHVVWKIRAQNNECRYHREKQNHMLQLMENCGSSTYHLLELNGVNATEVDYFEMPKIHSIVRACKQNKRDSCFAATSKIETNIYVLVVYLQNMPFLRLVSISAHGCFVLRMPLPLCLLVFACDTG